MMETGSMDSIKARATSIGRTVPSYIVVALTRA